MWLFVALSLLFAAIFFQRLLGLGEGTLAWERGRRRARQPFRKSGKVYEFFGVTSTEEYHINARGVELFSKQWLPIAGMPKAVIFYCHGYGDTCTHTWEDTAIQLASQGFAVVSMDYEGHGLSGGLHGYIRKFKNLVDDVVELSISLRLRPEFAGLPFFLYGESMGGAVAIQTHRRQPHAWAGAVLVAPMCQIAEEMMPPPAVISFLRLLAYIVPTWKLVPTKPITDVGFRDPEKRERVRCNPVGYFGQPRLMTALQLLLTTEEIGRNLHEVCLPLLVLHGGADVVTSPECSKQLVARSCSADKSLKIYDKAWHGLTSAEPDEVSSQVVADIVTWLSSRCSSNDMYEMAVKSMWKVEAENARWGLLYPTTALLEEDAQSCISS